MKIVCDNCATKYSIADDKVRGKVFKIRCKKCSHIIVVRGGEGGSGEVSAPGGTNGEAGNHSKANFLSTSDSEATTVASHGDSSVWHLVIDREQVGPMTAEQVRQRFARGEVDGE